ncbi:hypothetical protein FEM08_26070 [Flavobacterium gilvum]|nr:hypothetical protein FEM08_26070 [Flavobacterium gilvum]
MIDFEKIKKWNDAISKNQERLNKETDIKKKEKLRLKIQIDTLKIKVEKLN